jgi:inorganic triphosphatase YgiF
VSPAKSSAAPSWHTPGNTYEEIESKYHDFIATAPAQTSTMQDFLNAQFGPKEADKVYDLYLNTPGNMLEAIKVYLNLPKASSP